MTTTTHERPTWTAADFGAAMVAHYTSTAKGWRKRSDGVEGPAAYRSGDNASAFRIVEARGVAMDARRERSFSARQYAEEIAGTDLRTFMDRYGSSAGVVRRPAPPARAETFPPLAEVHALWDACVAVDLVPQARAWLELRGLDVVRLVDSDALRAVPPSIVLPSWAAQRERLEDDERGARHTWADSFAVVAPLFDAQGVMRSLHARRTVDLDTLSKTASPPGFTTRGLVLADRLGAALLAGTARAHVSHVSATTTRPGVVIVEGLPSFAAWATDASDADDDAPAVLGLLSGSWTPELAARIPDGARVLVDVDHDAAGDGYAARITESLACRVDLGRMERTA